jgi:hypothetical protein
LQSGACAAETESKNATLKINTHIAKPSKGRMVQNSTIYQHGLKKEKEINALQQLLNVWFVLLLCSFWS